MIRSEKPSSSRQLPSSIIIACAEHLSFPCSSPSLSCNHYAFDSSSISGIPMDTTDVAGGSALDSKIVPRDSTIRQAPTTEATTFFSLPRELRDQIYSYISKSVYTQISLNAFLRNLQLD